MIIIEVVFDAAAGKREEFIGLMRRTMEATRREKGCVLYRFAADIETAGRFVLTEIWETEDALKAHFRCDAFKAFFEQLAGMGRFVDDTAWQGPLAPYVPPAPGTGART